MAMFNPRYYGSVFTVLYSNDPLVKNPIRAHLLTSKDSFELISADWASSLQKFAPADIALVEDKKTSVVLAMKPGSKVTTVTLSTSPFSSEPLARALSTCSQLSRPELCFQALSDILPTFNFKDLPQKFAVHKGFMDASVALTQLCQSPNKTDAVPAHIGIVDALTCLFRFRYRNSNVTPADQSVPATVLSVKRRLLVLWCRGLAKCAVVSENAHENVFHTELAKHIGNTISKICEDIGVETELPAKAAKYAGTGTPEGVEAAAQQLERDMQQALDGEIAGLTTCDPGHVELIQHEVITVLAAVRIGLYDADVTAFAAKILACTKAAIQKNDVQERAELAAAHDDFLKDMLGYLDGIRYEEKFQFVFCLSEPAPANCGTAQFE
jgi:hypothetical protein